MLNFSNAKAPDNIKGRLKKTYNTKLTLGKLPSKKFLCTRAIKIDDATVERLIKSPKYLVKWLVLKDEATSLSDNFAEMNGFQHEGNNYYKENSCGIYAIKNKINGEEVVEMCLIKTFRRPDSISVSLYYLPNGDCRNMCFVARVCQHETNEHQNTDGTIIKPGETHFHKMSEEYFNKTFETYKKDPKKLAEKLQSPDAELMPYLETQEDIVNYATYKFNMVWHEIEVFAEQEQKTNNYYIDEKGKVMAGLANATLTDKIAEAINEIELGM